MLFLLEPYTHFAPSTRFAINVPTVRENCRPVVTHRKKIRSIWHFSIIAVVVTPTSIVFCHKQLTSPNTYIQNAKIICLNSNSKQTIHTIRIIPFKHKFNKWLNMEINYLKKDINAKHHFYIISFLSSRNNQEYLLRYFIIIQYNDIQQYLY